MLVELVLEALVAQNFLRMSKLKKFWNIIKGNDLNRDGKVDIEDKLIAAERKAEQQLQEIDLFKPGKNKE